MANVGIVIVSHSAKVAEGAADMVRQMVGDEVPLAWAGGNAEGGLGTDVGAIMAAIEEAWSEAGVAVMALGQSPKGWSRWATRVASRKTSRASRSP